MRKIIYLGLILLAMLVGCKQEGIGTSSKQESSLTDEDDDLTQQTINDDYVYQLPVVFHVLYQDASNATQYIPAERLQTILNQVNELFQGNVYGDSEQIKVRFFMAKFDENNKPLATPGVEYIAYTEPFPINPQTFMNDDSGKNVRYIWEPNDYINIVVYPFDTTGDEVILGISHIPYVSRADSTIEGLTVTDAKQISKRNLKFAYCTSLNSNYIQSESTRYTLADKGKGGYTYNSSDVTVTLAHELGHYLGLFHTFAEDKTSNGYEAIDNCLDSDFCDDTPSYNKLAYDKQMSIYLAQTSANRIDMRHLVKRNNCDLLSFNSENIMDYAVSYSFQFTPQQKHRMRQVLYFSQLIPGPKKNRQSTRSAVISQSPLEEINLPIRTMK